MFPGSRLGPSQLGNCSAEESALSFCKSQTPSLRGGSLSEPGCVAASTKDWWALLAAAVLWPEWPVGGCRLTRACDGPQVKLFPGEFCDWVA